MKSRGFMLPFWPSERMGADTQRIYEFMAMQAAVSFRACSGPEPDLAVVDCRAALSAGARAHLGKVARIVTGGELGRDIPWEAACFSKLLCLANSPWAETCLFDADQFWAGTAVDVFNSDEPRGGADVGGVLCENYSSTGGGTSKPGVCASVTISRSPDAIRSAMTARARATQPNADECILDRAVLEGLITRSHLPREWSFDGLALFGPGPGPFHNWKRTAIYDDSAPLAPGRWIVDGVPVRAFHASGNVREVFKDRVVISYLDRCADVVGLPIVRL
jgi:hypothetical protein